MSDPTSLPNFPPPADVRPLRGRVLDALQDLKFDPDLDSEGDVAFTAAEHKLFVRSMDNDKFDIMRTFGQWKIADRIPPDMETRLNACNDVTLGMNLVKAGIAGGNLILTVEQVIAKKENPKAKLSISVGLLIQAVALWHKNVIVKSGGTLAPGEVGEGVEAPTAQPWLSQAAMPPESAADDADEGVGNNAGDDAAPMDSGEDEPAAASEDEDRTDG
ncbi:hypothetical protein BH23ACT6_BH23ACT6_08290 [soil metagenome]